MVHSITVEYSEGAKGTYVTYIGNESYFPGKTKGAAFVKTAAIAHEKKYPYRPNSKDNVWVTVDGLNKPKTKWGKFPENGTYVVIKGELVEVGRVP